jgi:hypothetical protein
MPIKKMINQSNEEVAVNHRVVRVFSVQELYERYLDREFLMPLDLGREIMSSRQSRREQNKEKAKAYQDPIPEQKAPAQKKKTAPEPAKKEEFKKRRLYDQAYREANREKIREKARIRRDLHKEKEKAQCRDYYQKKQRGDNLSSQSVLSGQ